MYGSVIGLMKGHTVGGAVVNLYGEYDSIIGCPIRTSPCRCGFRRRRLRWAPNMSS